MPKPPESKKADAPEQPRQTPSAGAKDAGSTAQTKAARFPASLTMQPIGVLHTEFPEKFGIPRQSGLVDSLCSTLEFLPEFRSPEAVRGLEGFAYVWLIWQFTQAKRPAGGWSPTVRPPRLGGNTRMGVFATRSPFRPNPIGLSCVRLVSVEAHTPRGPLLHLAGADLLDGTPIFDVKPYLPFTEAHPEAAGGFAAPAAAYQLQVLVAPELLQKIPQQQREALLGVLQSDPRPAYQNDPDRVYGLRFAGFSVRFSVDCTARTLMVQSIEKEEL